MACGIFVSPGVPEMEPVPLAPGLPCQLNLWIQSRADGTKMAGPVTIRRSTAAPLTSGPLAGSPLAGTTHAGAPAPFSQ